MTPARVPRTLVVLLALAAAAGCASDGFSPSAGTDLPPAEDFTATTALGATELPDSAMTPVAVAAGAPAPVSDVVSFYATNREDRSVSILLPAAAGSPSFDGHGHGGGHGHGNGNGHGPPPQNDHGHGVTPGDGPGTPLGNEYVRLTVWKNSLLAWPDGHPVSGSDSVLITLRLVDPSKLLFEFEPSGLTFSVSKPAELRVNYAVAGGDLDGDGQVTAADSALVAHFGIWHQAAVGAAFQRLGSAISAATRTVRADIPGFSRYAVSY